MEGLNQWQTDICPKTSRMGWLNPSDDVPQLVPLLPPQAICWSLRLRKDLIAPSDLGRTKAAGVRSCWDEKDKESLLGWLASVLIMISVQSLLDWYVSILSLDHGKSGKSGHEVTARPRSLSPVTSDKRLMQLDSALSRSPCCLKTTWVPTGPHLPRLSVGILKQCGVVPRPASAFSSGMNFCNTPGSSSPCRPNRTVVARSAKISANVCWWRWEFSTSNQGSNKCRADGVKKDLLSATGSDIRLLRLIVLLYSLNMSQCSSKQRCVLIFQAIPPEHVHWKQLDFQTSDVATVKNMLSVEHDFLCKKKQKHLNISLPKNMSCCLDGFSIQCLEKAN